MTTSTPFEPPRILLTNDDGIDAEGLAVLEAIARQLSDDVWLVAPHTNQSGTSHALTIRRPIRVYEHGPRRFAIEGTPTDCVMLAMQALIEGKRPDIVLSGINSGANVAEDVTYSGTIGAAIEATLFDVRAIALSQVMNEGHGQTGFAAARAHGLTVIERLLREAWPANVLMSVNFPACPADDIAGLEIVDHGKRKLGDEIVERFDPRGERYYWIGHLRSKPWDEPGSDLDTIRRKRVSVTPINLTMTDRPTLERFNQVLERDLGQPTAAKPAAE